MDQLTIVVDDISADTMVEARMQARRMLEEETVALVAAAAHDLRTRLTAIKGFTQRLRRGLDRDGELDRAQVAQRLERIEGMVTQMNDLSGELVISSEEGSGTTITIRLPIDDETAQHAR